MSTKIQSTTMTLSENNSTESHYFPTHAAYLIPVEIKDITQYGEGQKGVFAIEHIPKGTKLWVWTHRVVSIHRKDLEEYIEKNFGCDKRKIQIFLRQGFVLPPSSSSETMKPLPPAEDSTQSADNTTATISINPRKDDFFHSNPTDSGRLTNHSSDPNVYFWLDGPAPPSRKISVNGWPLGINDGRHHFCFKYHLLSTTKGTNHSICTH
jgi:hypothetical protein